MNAERPVVVTESEAAQVKSIAGKDKDEVKKGLLQLLRNVFYGLQTERMEGEVEELGKKAERGELDKTDMKLLARVKESLGLVEVEVGGLVEKIGMMVENGDPRGARDAAVNVLKKYGGFLRRTDSQRYEELEKLVKSTTVEIGRLEAAQNLTESQAGRVYRLNREQGRLVENREGKVRELFDQTMVETGKKEARRGIADLDKLEKRSKPKAKTKDSVTDTARQYLKRAFRRQGFDQSYSEALDHLVDSGMRVERMSPDDAARVAVEIKKYQEALKRTRNQECLDGVGRGARRWKKVKLEFGAGANASSVEIDVAGDVKERIEQILPRLTGDDDLRDREVGYIVETSGLGRNEALNVWNKYSGWRESFGAHEVAVEELREEAWRVALKGGIEQVAEFGTFDIETTLGGGNVPYTVENSQISETRNEKGEWVVESNERARKNQSYIERARGGMTPDQLRQLIESDEDGGTRFRNEVFEQYKDNPQFRENASSFRLPRGAENWSEQQANAYAWELARKIMLTEESSRDPKNQEATWGLYAIFGLDSLNDNVRSEIAATLALYDVSVFMGSVESYDQWSKVASFLWKEAWEVLERQEKTMFFTQAGEEIKIDFKGMQTALELTVNGRGEDRDIWMAEILGSSNLEQLGINKRRFLASIIAEQLGVELRVDAASGKMVLGSDRDRQILQRKLGVGEEGFFRLVGLDRDGVKSIGGEADYDVNEDYYSKFGWMISNVLAFNHITMNSVEMERGGNGKFWKYMPNILRKLHGNGMYHYFHQKGMGGNAFLKTKGVIDSLWRSVFTWRLDPGKGMFTQELDKLVREQLGGNEQKEFFKWLKKAILSSDEASLGYGSRLSVGEIRGRAAEMAGAFGNNAFEWRDILEKRMGLNIAAGVDTRGRAGAQIFLENFGYKVFNYDSLEHGLLADFVKYTGVSSEWFKVVQEFVDYPSHGALSKAKDTLAAYHGNVGVQKKVGYMLGMFREASETHFRYETYLTSDGREESEVHKKGGEVQYDKDGNVEYRRGHVYYTKGMLNPFEIHGKGMPLGRRGFPRKTWKEKKEDMLMLMQDGAFTTDDFKDYYRDFKLQLWLGINRMSDETMGQALRRQWYKILTGPVYMPFTILFRGVLFDMLGLEWSDFGEFMKPGMAELGKIVQEY